MGKDLGHIFFHGFLGVNANMHLIGYVLQGLELVFKLLEMMNSGIRYRSVPLCNRRFSQSPSVLPARRKQLTLARTNAR
jgi:hypothetical protein